MTFNDLVDGGDDSYTINAASLIKPGTGGCDFYDIENVNLISNGGNDTINVNAVSSFATVNVSGSGGDDRFYVGKRNYAGNISGKLVIGGGSGTNQVQFDDQDDLGADVYTLGAGVFTKTGLKYATAFSGVQVASVAGNMDPNVFEVTPSATTRFVAYGRGPGFVRNGDVLQDERGSVWEKQVPYRINRPSRFTCGYPSSIEGSRRPAGRLWSRN